MWITLSIRPSEFQRVQLVMTERGRERPTIANADLEITTYDCRPMVSYKPVVDDLQTEDSLVFRIAKGLSWTPPNDILRLLAQGAVFLVSDEMVLPSGVARIDKKTVSRSQPR